VLLSLYCSGRRYLQLVGHTHASGRRPLACRGLQVVVRDDQSVRTLRLAAIEHQFHHLPGGLRVALTGKLNPAITGTQAGRMAVG